MSRFGNYQMAIDSLSKVSRFADRVKSEKNLLRKIKLYILFKKYIRKSWKQ